MPCIPRVLGTFRHRTWLLWGAFRPPLSPLSPTVLIQDQTPRGPPRGTQPRKSSPARGKIPWEPARVGAGGSGKGRKEGELCQPQGGTWASLLPGNHRLQRRGWELPAGRAGRAAGWFSGEGAAGLTSEAATSRPGPAAAGTPRGTRGSAGSSRGQRCPRPCPLPHQRCRPCPRPSCPPLRDKGPFVRGQAPSPLRLQETSLLPPAGRENIMWRRNGCKTSPLCP